MRKLILVLISIVVIITALAMNMEKLDSTLYASGQYIYKLDYAEKATIVQFNADEGQSELTIPSFLDIYEVNKIAKNAIDCTGFVSLYLPDTLTDVENDAFVNCEGIINLSVPSQFKATNCFEGLTNLKSLNISYGYNGNMNDFENSRSTPWSESVSSIERLSIDNGVKYLGNFAFSDMIGLTDVNFAESIEAIGKYCFYNDKSLNEIKLPFKLETISESAFILNNDISAIFIIPQNVTNFGKNCFNNMNNYKVYNNNKAVEYFEKNKIDYRMVDISFEESKYDIKLGTSTILKLKEEIDQEESVVFISDNIDVLSIDENGKILTHGIGSAKVTVITSMGNSSTIVNVYEDKTVTNYDYKVLNVNDEIMVDLSDFKGLSGNGYDDYIFSSDNEDIISVDSSGLIKAHDKGSATIKIEDKNGKTGYYLINAIEFVKKIEVKEDTINLKKGNTNQLETVVYPITADNRQLIYSSSNEKVATVSSKGVITALKDGAVIITISSTDGSMVIAKVSVNITSAVISCNNEPVILMIGKSYQLNCSINEKSKLYYLTTDDSIASVDETGLVKANEKGSCNIVVYNKAKTAYKTIKCIVMDGFSYGIDLSEWNGLSYNEANFKQLKSDGIDFVYLRAAYEDDYFDGSFERNYSAATAAGLDVGAYHYITATNIDKAISEAKFMLSLLEGKRFQYPVMLDIEDDVHKKLSDDEFNAVIDTYCEILKENGYAVIVYSYASLLNRMNGDWDSHVANWGVESPDYCKKYTIWQFTSSGTVKGISGKVDMNICLFDYPTFIKENHLNGY